MNIHYSIRLAGVLCTAFVFSTCHPWQWGDLPKINPECPIVKSIYPTGAKFDSIVTVYGSGFDANSMAQFTLVINGTLVDIMDMKDSTSLRFKVPKNIGSGLVNVRREGVESCGTGKQFTYYYSLKGTPTVFAGVRDETECVDCLNSPSGLDLDVSGNLYIADMGHQIIRQVTPLKKNTIIAGRRDTSGVENNPFNGRAATFADPSDLAIDPAGNIFVTDMGNHRIRKINNAAKWPVSTLTGSTKGGGNSETNLANAHFDTPIGIATDSSGKIYVSEFLGNRLRIIEPELDKVYTLVNSGLKFPAGVDCYPLEKSQGNTLFLADLGSGVVRSYNLSGSTQNVPAIGSTPFFAPYDVALDNKGNLFATDQGRFKVYIVYADMKVQELEGYNFTNPTGVVFDERRNLLFVSDNRLHVIVRFELE